MIFKIKKFFLLISLFLLQSCSGGKVGNFLELSFDNLENIDNEKNLINVLDDKKVIKTGKKEINKTNIAEAKKEKNLINDLNDKKIIKTDKKEINKTNIAKAKKEKNLVNVFENKKLLSSDQKLDKSQKTKKLKDSLKKKELQTYKIIFILKDVDPKDPIEELSTILRDSEVNFEIEKIERFLDSKNKNMKGI